MKIFEYKAEYQEGILNMILKIQREEYDLQITAADQPDLANIETVYQQDGGNFWVAVEDGVVAGTIAIKNIGSGNAMLRKMFIRKEYRGQASGLSNKLLSLSIDWSRQKKFNNIFLGTTEQFIAAHRFYEKNGFVLITREDLPAGFPVMKVDNKFYRYKL